MGLTMGQRKAVTKAIATWYRRASKAEKSKILDELCATTGWHRSHARKALGAALRPTLVPVPRRPRTPVYGPDVLTALRFCWAVLGAPTDKRLAPVMLDLVPRLRRFGELKITDEVALTLLAMGASTMDRRLAAARAAMSLKGRSHTKPGSLLKSQIPNPDLGPVGRRGARVRGAVLDERQRRLLLGAEAMSLGRGGVTLVAAAAGVGRPMVTRGVAEVRAGVASGGAGIAADRGRVRKPGGGWPQAPDGDRSWADGRLRSIGRSGDPRGSDVTVAVEDEVDQEPGRDLDQQRASDQ